MERKKMIEELIHKNRSYRRFDQKHIISLSILKELVELARHSASAANLQPLKYILVCNEKTNRIIFEKLSWAGYLKDWPGPVEGERPSAYIIILGDTTISKSFSVDHGIASQSILLGADHLITPKYESLSESLFNDITLDKGCNKPNLKMYYGKKSSQNLRYIYALSTFAKG